MQIVPALKLAICWDNFLNLICESQSAGNPITYFYWGILRDYTFDILCWISFTLSALLNGSGQFYSCSLLFLSPSALCLKTANGQNGLNKQCLYSSAKKTTGYAYSSLPVAEIAGAQLDKLDNNITFNPLFCSYLAGLIEGDGTFVVPKRDRSDKGNLYYSSIQIIFDERDFPLAMVIQKELGFGSIIKYKDKKAYRLNIYSLKDVVTIVNMINGYMRTVKINNLYKLIDFLNMRHNLNILKKGKDTSPIDSNAWLAGFIESDGSFYVNYTPKSSSLACKFYLNQSTKNHLGLDKIEIMQDLASFLNVKVANRTIEKKYSQYSVTTNSVVNNQIIIDYLDKFPLFSSKFLNYQDFKTIVNLIIKKEHKTDAGKEKIQLIKSGMNNKRTYFNWDHLQRFYTAYSDKK